MVYPHEKIPADSLKNAVDQIIATIKVTDTIGEIQFWGHGAPGEAKIGNDTIKSQDFNNSSDFARLKPYLTRESRIYFRSCETFANPPGRAFALDAAQFFNCRVAGHTQVIGVSQPGYQELKPGEQPNWPNNDTSDKNMKSKPKGKPAKEK